MFEKNDKTFFVLRKIVNIALFVCICACALVGLILVFSSIGRYAAPDYYYNTYKLYTYVDSTRLAAGLGVMLAGPVVFQFVWLITDICFNKALDVKIIRNAQLGLETPELPAPICFKKKSK